MKCLQLLMVCWCSSVLTVSCCITVDGYSCVSAYWDTVSCVVNITGDPDTEQSNSSYSLKFTENWSNVTYTCPLTAETHSHSCVCKVNNDEIMADYFNFKIRVCDDAGCQSLNEAFNPTQNIQLTAPREVNVTQTPEAFNITWKSGYEDHLYLAEFLVYEVLLFKPHSSGKLFSFTGKFGSIPRSRPEAPATYCTKVRSKTFESHYVLYHGTWSQWSRPTCWENDMQEAFSEQEHLLVTLTKLLGPMCVVMGVVLCVFYSPTARMKIKTLSHTPSPAPFFQPLYQQHDGNLQEWLGPQGKFALTYSTDEILISDVLNVVHKPITKDAEENQDLYNLAVTPLTFSQCHTSYVAAPGGPQPPPVTVLCPADTPYTQLPCSVWGFGSEDVQEKPSPPEDFLDTSHEDSGCSCKDMTPSPECSLPNSPVDASPPPCFCTDYCLLNKTAGGLVPVLVK
ncbi:interleukin-21 receptor-like [Solea senegalensis]|nr:interleukin 21 receptor, tandem duplicate 2 isoform X1 [Solea senegalensis]XP_043891027.1 interleukin 21 receptor, tandem duplicate 2 isoform X1 [Solea senegalensis]KAG7474748.1 interleukin-21 receptor-like [Solea senegalensis]